MLAKVGVVTLCLVIEKTKEKKKIMFIGFLILFVRLSHLFFLHLVVFPLKKKLEEIRDRVSEFMFANIGCNSLLG